MIVNHTVYFTLFCFNGRENEYTRRECTEIVIQRISCDVHMFVFADFHGSHIENVCPCKSTCTDTFFIYRFFTCLTFDFFIRPTDVNDHRNFFSFGRIYMNFSESSTRCLNIQIDLLLKILIGKFLHRIF